MPSQIHFRANFFRLFCPLSSPSSSCHFSFLPIKTKNQTTPLISFLGLSFWKKGPREHNIIRSKREQNTSLQEDTHDDEPSSLEARAGHGHERHHLHCLNWLDKWRDVSELRWRQDELTKYDVSAPETRQRSRLNMPWRAFETRRTQSFQPFFSPISALQHQKSA